MGEQKFLNPTIYPTEQEFEFTDRVGSKNTAKSEAFVVFKPKDLASVFAAPGSTNLTDKKTDIVDLVDAGDWFFNINNGKLTTFSALDSTDKLKYTVDPADFVFGTETLPSVIPDPRQLEYTRCRISKTAGTFFVHLPPRRPLSITGLERPNRYPSVAEVTDNEASSTGSPRQYWQIGTGSALDDSHYRYRLGKELDDVVDSLSDGDDIPAGFLYLWNNDEGTIVADAVFKKSTANRWVFQISASSIDLNANVTTDETVASYTTSPFSVICAGAPVSRTIWTILKILLSASNTNASMRPYEKHSSFKDTNPPSFTSTDHPGSYPSDIVDWAGSRWAGDDHLSLAGECGVLVL